MKRFLALFLAFIVLGFSISVPAFADDSGELVCPECASSLTFNEINSGFFSTLSYRCTNCDYHSSSVKFLGWNFYSSGSPSDPVYKDGNTVYTLPGGDAPVQPNISTSGRRRYYLHPEIKEENSMLSVSGNTLQFYGKLSGIAVSLPEKVYWSIDVPISGVYNFGLEFDCYPSGGKIYTSEGTGSCAAGVAINGTEYQRFMRLAYPEDENYKLWTSIRGTLTAGDTLSINNSNYGAYCYTSFSSQYFSKASFRFYIDLVGDEFGNLYDFAVTDNNHINTTDSTITVNGNSITYNKAYYDNGVYYIYTDNGVSTYYTDSSGQIIGDVTYDNSSNVYNITIYNQAPPSPSPSPDPDNPPTPTPGADTCKHDYKVIKEFAATCTEPGYKNYKCNLCGNTYTETLKALGHDWVKVESVLAAVSDSSSSPPVDSSSSPPDSSAPPPTASPAPSYTLYRCTRCGIEYKDTDGSGPPAPPDDGEDEDNWFVKLIKSIVNGFLKILNSIVGGVIDLVVSLIDDLVDGVVKVIDGVFDTLDKLAGFGSQFKLFLGEFFSFFPPEFTALLCAGLSLGIVFSIIHFLRR